MFSVMVWNASNPDAKAVSYDCQVTQEQRSLAETLERVAIFFLRNLQQSVPDDNPVRFKGPYPPLFQYASHVMSLASRGELPFWKQEWVNDTRSQVFTSCAPYEHLIDVQLLRRIGSDLVSIVNGSTQAIEVAMEDGMLANYYESSLGMSTYTEFLAKVVKQISYRYPHMNILEIGAGTGGATKSILRELRNTFGSYTFTDISPGFFSTARDTFKYHGDKLAFNVLDIDRDPAMQGFESSSYDMIIASMVLHTTPCLQRTLKNARRLLKPGGYLVVLEGQLNHVCRLGALFGAFPGWWIGANDGRVLSPFVNLSEWDTLLRNTGFSGCDTNTHHMDPEVMPFVVFVSQAIDNRVQFLREPLTFAPAMNVSLGDLVIVGGIDIQTSRLIEQLKPLLLEYCDSMTTVRTWKDLMFQHTTSTTTLLSLTDVNKPFFRNLSEIEWTAFRGAILEAKSLAWITYGRRTEEPLTGMTLGLLRSALWELPALHFQFIDFEDVHTISAQAVAEATLRLEAKSIWQKQTSQDDLLMSIEQELVVDADGKETIPRLVPDFEMNNRYNSRHRPIHSQANLDHEIINLVQSKSGYNLVSRTRPTGQDTTCITISHSLLSGVRVSDMGCMFLGMGTSICSDDILLCLSTEQTSIANPWANLSVPVNVPSGYEDRFLGHVALDLILSVIIEGLSEGDRLLVLEPSPEFAAILTSKSELGKIKVTFATIGCTQTSPLWVAIHPAAPCRDIRRLVSKPIATFIDFTGYETNRSIGNQIREHLHAYSRYENIDTLFNNVVCEPTGSRLELVKRRLKSAVATGERLISQAGGRNTSNPPTPVYGLGNVNGILPPQTVVNWTRELKIPINVQPVESHIKLSACKTYWLAGLTHGLGQSLCEWMIRHGARNVVLSSRRPNIENSWLDTVMSTYGANIRVFNW